MSKLLKVAVIAISTLLLAACNDNSSTPPMGTLSIALTDAPVDNVSAVWVEFSGITVKPQSGDPIDFTFDSPKDINLMDLTGGNSSDLLNGEQLSAGQYDWIRLDVNAKLDGVMDSYVMTTLGQQVELEVPSQQGLQLSSGFTITQGEQTSFVIDWNLTKGLTAPVGQSGWKLRPSLRITDTSQYGSISGTVDSTLVTDTTCTNDLSADTGDRVYIFSGADVTPVDIQGASTDPLATADVKADSNGVYKYKVDYLATGDYTVAFTCQAADDDPTAVNTLVFSASANATVTNGADAVIDFP